MRLKIVHLASGRHEYDRRVIATSEYELVTESAGLLDRSERAMFTVRGGEAADFLQGQVSNDVEGLAPGHGCYATILNHKGKLRTDLRVLRGQDFFWLDTEPIGHAVLRHMLDTYSLGRDVQWEDVGEAHSILSLLGPGADALLDDPPPPNEHAFVDTGAGLWVRTDLGVDLLCTGARADELRAELGVEEVSEEVAECLRIESGRPRLGLDMDADTIPEEAGINERAVDFEKGCYVGQEVTTRMKRRDLVKKLLMPVTIEGEAPQPGTKVLSGDVEAGELRSSRDGVGLALLRLDLAQDGKTLTAGAARIVPRAG